MGKRHNRILAGIMSIAMAASAAYVLPASAAVPESLSQYTMYASSDEAGAVTLNSYYGNVNGTIVTNGTVKTKGILHINGRKNENASEAMGSLFEEIDEKYFSGSVENYDSDFQTEKTNVHLKNAVSVKGSVSVNGNINLNASLKADKDIVLSGQTLNTHNTAIVSEYGDITISSRNVNITGIIYAPFGTVTITSDNVNLNQTLIIADSIELNCFNFNANSSRNSGIAADADTASLNAIKADTSGLVLREDGAYQADSANISLGGYLGLAGKTTSFGYEVYDIHGGLRSSASIEADTEWNVSDLGLSEGYNRVVLRSETSGGKVYEQELVIFVPQVLDYNKQALRDLRGVSNARQLGGYINKDGRAIKQNVLLRTGNLSHITDSGIEALQNKYNVSDIMDFRYDRELNPNTIDREIEGVVSHSIPMSATRDHAAQVFSQNPELFAQLQKLQRNAGTPEGSIAMTIFQAEVGVLNAKKHIEYFESDEAVEYYRDVFDVFLNKPEDSAILFHCAGGKDRTGMISMLILAALDFDKDIMMQDYLMTNIANADKIAQLTAAAEAYTDDPELRYNIIFGSAVYPEIMETNIDDFTEQYGSVKNFLRERVGLTDDDFAKLRELYLED